MGEGDGVLAGGVGVGWPEHVPLASHTAPPLPHGVLAGWGYQ